VGRHPSVYNPSVTSTPSGDDNWRKKPYTPPLHLKFSPFSPSKGHSSSTGTSSQLISFDDVDDHDLEVGVSSTYNKERAMFPGEIYQCQWAQCGKRLVSSPIPGEHPVSTQERFQDTLENHIKDHVWFSACGRRTKRNWPCRWGECTDIFANKRSLIGHIGAHAGFIRSCAGCGASYSRYDSLRKHRTRCSS
jgi:hypothetical protein